MNSGIVLVSIGTTLQNLLQISTNSKPYRYIFLSFFSNLPIVPFLADRTPSPNLLGLFLGFAWVNLLSIVLLTGISNKSI